jgi:hypothetical protein
LAKVDKIAKLENYDGMNPISKNLRWVKPITTLERSRCMFALSKDNDLVGFYPGSVPILFDERFKDKWFAEFEKEFKGPERLKMVSNEDFLTQVAQGIFALSQQEISRAAVISCFHVRTNFKDFTDASCPDCGESVSPMLVMGYLLTSAQELNEIIWEHKGEKGVAKVEKEAESEGE